MKNKVRPALRLLLLAALAGFPARKSHAQAIPALINYQGVLQDSSGSLINGSQSITFRVYDALSGGNKLWEEAQSVQLSSGVFSVQLGLVTPWSLSIFATANTYLEIQVGADIYSPRWRLVTSPYAANAGLLQGKDFSNVFASGGNVGIGTSNPIVEFHVKDAGGNFARVYMQSSNNAAKWQISADGVSGGGGVSGGFRIFDDLAGQARLVINASGNVGIGTSNPGAKLEVNGTVKVTDGSQGAGKVLTSDGNGLASWQSLSGGGSFSNMSVFTANGNFAVPSGITKIMVEAWASGGGGGGGAGVGGSGGGGGGYGRQIFSVAPGQSYTVTVGPPGTAGSSGGNGGSGNTSSFVGGSINMSATGGGGGIANSGNTNGGAGGSSGATFNMRGGNGSNSTGSGCGYGGGAGANGGPGGAGNCTGAGIAGSDPGGGGGGGLQSSAGGSGGNGRVVVWY